MENSAKKKEKELLYGYSLKLAVFRFRKITKRNSIFKYKGQYKGRCLENEHIVRNRWIVHTIILLIYNLCK